ncbi:MAG: hypothetical protein JNL58_25350 [Planctomyces sp.]|nr:hypothetical protein [Planctomyces sp.]
MIDREYVVALLAWGILIGFAVGAALLFVPRGSRRRAINSTVLFAIPLSILGFVDGISKQLGLVECSGGVVVTALLIVVMLGLMDRCFFLGNRLVATRPGDER